MRMRDSVAIFVLMLGCAGARAESPDLGRVATPDEIAAWDISIDPSGAGLPAGSGTARAGAAIFAAKCAGCHAKASGGKPHDALRGAPGRIVTHRPAQAA